jgi:hypothetical protein
VTVTLSERQLGVLQYMFIQISEQIRLLDLADDCSKDIRIIVGFTEHTATNTFPLTLERGWGVQVWVYEAARGPFRAGA